MIKMLDVKDPRAYWEAWKDGKSLIVHSGSVGEIGIVDTQSDVSDAEAEMQRLASEMRGKGFIPLDPDELVEFVVQYKIDKFGTQDDLNKRHEIEEALNKALGWTGNGHCDGGDVGSGTMNVWCYVVDPIAATQTVKTVLSDLDYLDNAVIAYSRDDNYTVTHPIGGQFIV